MTTRADKRIIIWAGRILLAVAWVSLSVAIAQWFAGCATWPPALEDIPGYVDNLATNIPANGTVILSPAQSESEWPDYVLQYPAQPTALERERIIRESFTAVEWPAYRGDNWTTHGWEGENEERERIIREAAASGTGAIRFRHLGVPPANDLAAWLFRFKGERRDFPLQDKGWYYRAKAAGITRWVAEIGEDHRARWRDIFAAYDNSMIQYVIKGRVINHADL
jgi:hypothetical protein